MPTPECAQIIHRLPDYVEGDASAARCAEVEYHLEGCADCRVLLAALRQNVHDQHAEPRLTAIPDRQYRTPGLGSPLRF
jgi:anti-sigma factor RsiW